MNGDIVWVPPTPDLVKHCIYLHGETAVLCISWVSITGWIGPSFGHSTVGQEHWQKLVLLSGVITAIEYMDC